VRRSHRRNGECVHARARGADDGLEGHRAGPPADPHDGAHTGVTTAAVPATAAVRAAGRGLRARRACQLGHQIVDRPKVVHIGVVHGAFAQQSLRTPSFPGPCLQLQPKGALRHHPDGMTASAGRDRNGHPKTRVENSTWLRARPACVIFVQVMQIGARNPTLQAREVAASDRRRGCVGGGRRVASADGYADYSGNGFCPDRGARWPARNR
jgi:hypothetical protein